MSDSEESDSVSSELDRRVIRIEEAHKSSRFILPILMSVVIAVVVGAVAILSAFSVSNAGRIEAIGDRVSDARDVATTTAAEVILLRGEVASAREDIQTLNADLRELRSVTDYLQTVALSIARTVNAPTDPAPWLDPPDKDKQP